MGLRRPTYWDCWFESRCGQGYLCLVSVVCCQVEVSATADYFSSGVVPSVCEKERVIECDQVQH
jgi:hypothetical protein